MGKTKKRAEAAAKVALLDHLQKRKRLSAHSVVASELLIARQTVRADIVHVARKVAAYEIKTASDSLVRLSRQMDAYAAVFDEVWVVAATRHLDRVAAEAPATAGIYELAGQVNAPSIKLHRAARKSDSVAASSLLDALPVDAILSLMRAGGVRNPPRLRRDATDLALSLPLQHIRTHFRSFLLARYGHSSAQFQAAIATRGIAVRDLELLRAWEPLVRKTDDSQGSAITRGEGYGSTFGPVPDDIKALLAA